jgi:transposase
MSSFTLSLSERRALARQIHGTKDAKILKRAQTFLWLSDGMSVEAISKRFGLSRQTLYYWVSSYQKRRNRSFTSRLQDRPKPGRPPRKSTVILRELAPLLHTSPRHYGYPPAEWTASLLATVLHRAHALKVSPQTLRRGLQPLRDVWKRPGDALARQSATWAPAKGGAKAGATIIQDG